MRIDTFIRHLTLMSNKVNSAAIFPFRSEFSRILKDLQRRSPVSKGVYRSQWKMENFASSGNLLAGVRFFNADKKEKAALMEFGAYPNDAPWYFPGTKKKHTGKLAVSMGQVWPGGLNPGHQWTIGGAINPVIYANAQRQTEIITRIADRIIKAV